MTIIGEEMKPLGANPKLDELMVLVAVEAACESGNGYDIDVLTRHAKRATDLWNTSSPEAVTVMREALEEVIAAREAWMEADDESNAAVHALARMCRADAKARAALSKVTVVP